jgi:hypothetical protein
MTRIGDKLYFSPRFRFSDLDVGDKEKLVEALRDRLMGFYLEPASRLVNTGDAFAAGLLCCAAIGFVALCSGEDHPEIWLCKNIREFGGDKVLAKKFWKWFRDGLIHEGRVKAFGQFSLEFPNLLNTDGRALVVNPKVLLEAIQKALQRYFENIGETQSVRLIKRLERYFGTEIAAAKKVP